MIKLFNRTVSVRNNRIVTRSLSTNSSIELVKHRLQVWQAEAARQEEKNGLEGSTSMRIVNGNNRDEFVTVQDRLVRPMDLPWLENSDAVVATIGLGNSKTWDLTRPLLPDGSGSDELVVTGHGFASEPGRDTFWHSTAHLLGAAIETTFGLDSIYLCDGPALEATASGEGIVAAGMGGFFYDLEFIDKSRSVSDGDMKTIKKHMASMAKKGYPFERMEISEAVAREMFAYNPRKIEMIDRLVAMDKDVLLTAYRCGSFIDLCRGPHVTNTKVLHGGMDVLRSNGISDGKEYRVYGISFPDKPALTDWASRTEEAAKRDHRVLGKKQQLFMFHSYSPGSAFMLPHGTLVYNRLLSMLRDQYSTRGYEEVMTPLIYSNKLWEQSGHLENYREHMYVVTEHEVDETEDAKGLKPMNCPGHCLIYGAQGKSFRDLPIRLADFSALHRNEFSGSLGGMTRLRRFHQDDAHIFCLPDQIEAEILNCIDFVRHVYQELFGFSFHLRLSTRPSEHSIGGEEEWKRAEDALENVLNATGLPWDLDPGEGAFYGPKIDITITDAIGRQHQCATIQLDFQLPDRFHLEYTCSGGTKQRPVMIHRAILGSMERFMAILIEHTGGKWPFWLSPRQIAILPVNNDAHGPHAHKLADQFRKCVFGTDFLNNPTAAGLSIHVDDSNESLSKRVRTAQQSPFNAIFVIGDKEIESEVITVRSNDGTFNETISLDQALAIARDAVKNRTTETFPFFKKKE